MIRSAVSVYPAHELAYDDDHCPTFYSHFVGRNGSYYEAQASRGADFTTGSLVKRAKNMVPLLVPLFISAFRRADELAVAMEARCYRGGENRTRMKELTITSYDYIGIAGVLVITVVLLVLRFVPIG